MTATRAHVLEWMQAQGLVALQEVFAWAAAEAEPGCNRRDAAAIVGVPPRPTTSRR